MTNNSHNYWAVVPAAGIGKRMGAEIPKQYLPLAGKTVIEHTLLKLLNHTDISGVVVAVAGHDQHWSTLTIASEKPLLTVEGGEERCHSVLNALRILEKTAHAQDWVLVHDAARPCIEAEDFRALISRVNAKHAIGGILGTPMRDTMKRSDAEQLVIDTVDRLHLWHAHTPQMFRLAQLRKAIEESLAAKQLVTDEASAMENAGFKPLMVEGRASNIKITHPADLDLAEYFLTKLSSEGCS